MADLRMLFKIFQYFGYIFDKKQKRQAVIVMFIILLGAFLELLGVSIILPFIQAFVAPGELAERWYIKPLISVFHIEDPTKLLYALSVCIILVYVGKNLFLAFVSYVTNMYNSELQRSLTVEMLRSYLDRPYLFFVESNTGELLNGVNMDITGVHNFLMAFFKFAAEAAVTLLIFLYLMSEDILLSLGIIGVAGVCSILVTLFVKKRISILSKKNRSYNIKRSGLAVSIVHNIKDILVFDKREQFIGQYEEASRAYANSQARITFINTLPERIIETFCLCGIILFIMLRLRFGVNTNEFIPVMSVFAMGAFRVLPSISRMAAYIQNFISNRPMVEATYQNIKSAREYKAEQNINISALDERHLSFQDTVLIDQIDWKYEKAPEKVLSGLSMEIRKGDMVGIIGESGSGKSTFGDILLALYTPQAGTIYMDGVDIQTIPKTWRKTISYVPQMLLLFNESIRFNISFSDDPLNDASIWEVLKEASLEEFVRSLPEGLDSPVGDRGIKLSGGQRQRIAIARALYSKPEILLLDEATSALDTETEAEVVEAINELSGKMTIVVIAHRLSTLKSCNKIYRIENGQASIVNKEEQKIALPDL